MGNATLYKNGGGEGGGYIVRRTCSLKVEKHMANIVKPKTSVRAIVNEAYDELFGGNEVTQRGPILKHFSK